MDKLANSNRAVFSVVVSDGFSEVSEVSPVFRKATPRSESELAEHVAGPAGAEIDVMAVSPFLLTGHTYRLSFDKLSNGLSYTVTDADLDEVRLLSIPLADAESPQFDGIRLRINDLEKARADPESTGWSAGTATVAVSVSANRLHIEGVSLEPVATAADYRVAMKASVQGNSTALFGLPETPRAVLHPGTRSPTRWPCGGSAGMESVLSRRSGRQSHFGGHP